MDSVEAKYFHSEGFLAAEIAVLRHQANIEDVFVILHFDGPPKHFACLHVKKSSLVYYDSLPNNNNRPRPFNEYPELRELGEIEFHVPTEYQAEEECGCMVVLRYWQLFHNEQHTDLRGKEARVQVLKYYNRDISKEVKALTTVMKSKHNKQGQGPLSHIMVFRLDCSGGVLGNVFSSRRW